MSIHENGFVNKTDMPLLLFVKKRLFENQTDVEFISYLLFFLLMKSNL